MSERVEVYPYRPGSRVDIWVNQGWRPATILAVIGDEYLCEYYMPNGTTGLRIKQKGMEGPGRSVVYRKIANKWLNAMLESGWEWECNPQQGHPISVVQLIRQKGLV